MPKFESSLGIGDEVDFIPMSRQRKKMGISKEKFCGSIVAVRFTKAKVLFDICDDYFGKVFKSVDSANVSASQRYLENSKPAQNSESFYENYGQ